MTSGNLIEREKSWKMTVLDVCYEAAVIKTGVSTRTSRLGERSRKSENRPTQF